MSRSRPNLRDREEMIAACNHNLCPRNSRERCRKMGSVSPSTRMMVTHNHESCPAHHISAARGGRPYNTDRHRSGRTRPPSRPANAQDRAQSARLPSASVAQRESAAQRLLLLLPPAAAALAPTARGCCRRPARRASSNACAQEGEYRSASSDATGVVVCAAKPCGHAARRPEASQRHSKRRGTRPTIENRPLQRVSGRVGGVVRRRTG
jgi:hypothetical protein